MSSVIAPRSQQLAVKKPAANPAKPAAQPEGGLGRSVAKLGSKAEDLASKGVDFVKKNPGEVVEGAALVAGTTLVIANRDKIANAILNNPNTASTVAGLSAYELAKNGGKIENAFQPANLGKTVHKAEGWTHAHPFITALSTAALVRLGLKAAKNAASNYEVAGYKPGDPVGAGVVVDPSTIKDTSTGYKVVTIEGHPTEKLVVKLPPRETVKDDPAVLNDPARDNSAALAVVGGLFGGISGGIAGEARFGKGFEGAMIGASVMGALGYLAGSGKTAAEVTALRATVPDQVPPKD